MQYGNQHSRPPSQKTSIISHHQTNLTSEKDSLYFRWTEEMEPWPSVLHANSTSLAIIFAPISLLGEWKPGGLAPYTVGEVASFEDPDHSTANMTPIQVCEFQRWAMRYQNILLVESGFRRMARRYRNEQASGAWRAFPQGGLTLPTTAITSTTTTSTQVAPPTAGTVVPTSAFGPGPSSGTPSGQPTGIDSTRPHTSSAGTQTAPAATVDPAAFQAMERKMDSVLWKISHLQRGVRQVNRRVRTIKRTLRRANL
ncbi:uncharacterized protein [Pleurodeles waltl]|uniref:uncharacterized protein isoform X4 n=1 Tax=Pleurodeles waltl TaxID=8319 RepID=UPI003709A2F1